MAIRMTALLIFILFGSQSRSSLAKTAASTATVKSNSTINWKKRLANYKKDMLETSKYQDVESMKSSYLELAKRAGGLTVHDEVFLNQVIQQGHKSEIEQRQMCGGQKQKNFSSRFGVSRNQGRLGWCFAHALADQLSYETGKNISASDLALTHYQDAHGLLEQIQAPNKKTTEFSAGSSYTTFLAAREKGLCLENNFKSNDNGTGNYKSLMNRIQGMQMPLLPIRNCSQESQLVQQIFPTLEIPEIKYAYFTSLRTNYIRSLADQACNPRIIIENKKMNYFPGQIPQDSAMILRKLNEGLNKNKPVLINLNGNVLRNSYDQSTKANHDTLIIGRRFNEKTKICEYQIRNSWGPSCEQYDSEFVCEKGKGYLWLPINYLQRSMSAASYIE